MGTVALLGRGTIHPFPARMAPGLAFEALKTDARQLTVLDPMAGSGTVLALAREQGHKALGFDLDPLAVLLARVWTRPLNRERVESKAREVLSRSRQMFHSMSTGTAYPRASDSETRKFVRYWFDDYARRQLASLAAAITRVRDEEVREVLWCGFSRLIITKSAGASLAMDLSHSRPHREFTTAPVKPFRRFVASVETVIANCPQEGADAMPRTRVRLGDALNLPVSSGTIDIVLTSPPYLNAIDYMRCSKFSLVWMGYSIKSLRDIRAKSVGAEVSSREASQAPWVHSIIKGLRLRPELPSRHYGLLARYVWDMGKAIGESARVLKAGGKAFYVVGDSVNGDTFIRNSTIVSTLATLRGLSLVSMHTRALPENRRYLPPPKSRERTAMNSRMRREVFLCFSKPL